MLVVGDGDAWPESNSFADDATAAVVEAVARGGIVMFASVMGGSQGWQDAKTLALDGTATLAQPPGFMD